MNNRILTKARITVAPAAKANNSQRTEHPPLASLTEREEAELSRCETVIEKHLKAFYEVGKALLHIRDRMLYRAEFPTFEEYCRSRWDISRVHAHRLLKATEVIDSVLLPMGNISLPDNERQVRPLVGRKPEEAQKAWTEATVNANGKTPTSKMVSAALKAQNGSRVGTTSKRLRESWQDRVEALLIEALKRAREGDKAGVEEMLFKIQLDLQIGRNTPDID